MFSSSMQFLNKKKNTIPPPFFSFFFLVTKGNAFGPPFLLSIKYFLSKGVSVKQLTKLITYQLHLQPAKQCKLLKLLKGNFFLAVVNFGISYYCM